MYKVLIKHLKSWGTPGSQEIIYLSYIGLCHCKMLAAKGILEILSIEEADEDKQAAVKNFNDYFNNI